MDIGLMVEGQNGLTWERWSRIIGLADRIGLNSVFRSDHYFIGRQQDSLDAWLSFVLAARETKNIRFGALVSPVTFRRPVDSARMGAQVDLLSGGRFVMGVGAGWNEAEHRAYGLPFHTQRERFERLEEWLQLMRILWTESPATYEGRYYQLEGADLLPKPASGRPPVLIGGNGEKRTLRLVARYADEWNCINLTPDALRHKLELLRQYCDEEGRDFNAIRISMMNFGVVGRTQDDLDTATDQAMSAMASMPRGSGTGREEHRQAARERGGIVGTEDEVIQQLGALAEVGLQEIMLQHYAFDSDATPEFLADVAGKV